MLLNEEANPDGHLLGSMAVGLDAVTGDTATDLDTSATANTFFSSENSQCPWCLQHPFLQ